MLQHAQKFQNRVFKLRRNHLFHLYAVEWPPQEIRALFTHTRTHINLSVEKTPMSSHINHAGKVPVYGEHFLLSFLSSKTTSIRARLYNRTIFVFLPFVWHSKFSRRIKYTLRASPWLGRLTNKCILSDNQEVTEIK